MRFLELLAVPDPRSPLWQQVWCVLLSHPWYQEQVRRYTARLLSAESITLDWQKDVEHDAMCLMARTLYGAPTLHLAGDPATPQFEALLRTTIRHHCAEALRSVRQKYLRETLHRDPDQAAARSRPIHISIDLTAALYQLPEEQQAALKMHLQRRTAREIAQELGISPSKAARLVREAKATLRRLLEKSYGKDR